MNRKTFIAAIGISALLLANPLVSFAQSVSPAMPNRTANLTRLNTNCANVISERVTSLTNANSRLMGLVKLAQNYKTQFSSEVSTDLTGLQTLQTQCTTDFNAGNVANLRTDYRNVFSQFRVYAVFLPQLWDLIASDTMGVTATKLSDLATKLQTRIQAAGNPSNLTTLLADMQAKIADANTQYANVETQVAPLTPSSYNTDPAGTTTILKNARGEIKTGATDLQAAWLDAKQIVQILKTMHTATNSGTPAQAK